MSYLWWDYWTWVDKVTFDGINKIITVNDGVTALNIRTEVYSSWVRWLTIEDNTKFLPAMRFTGLDVIPGGFTGDSYFLINGWKFYIDLSVVAVSGVLFSDDYPTPYYTPAGKAQYAVTVSSLVSAIGVSTNIVTGDLNSLVIPTAAQNASAVRTELSPELAKINAQVDGLTPTQQTMLLEIYRLYGLDPTAPLVVSDTSRVAGSINQSITSTPTQTTVQRV